MTPFLRYLSAAAALLVAIWPAQLLCAKPDAAELDIKYKQLSQDFAELVPGWRPQSPDTGSLLFVAPDQFSPAEKGDERFRDARNKQADALFDLARQAADAGQLSLAFQWATEAVRENPDHAEARRVLGYEQRDGQWVTAYGAKMFDAGKRWHPEFGWVPAADLPRYEAGERQIGGRWMPADVARRLADGKIESVVRTDHFLVSTNHSFEAAAELGGRLERLYQVWRQLFAGFYYTEKEVRGLFAGDRQPRTQIRPFRVVYHRDRDDYISALRRRQPRIAETLGIYFDTVHEAHFFAGKDVAAGGSVAAATGPPVATLYHEAVHQLFQESQPAARRIGVTANFWVIEGVATYFETLTEHQSGDAGLYFTVGESTAGRLPAARQRLREGFYVPLSDLTRLGKDEVQRHPDITKLYSEASGLAAFLIDGEHGRYREPLVRYLQAVYAGRDSDQSLSDSTGASYEDLDSAYRHYMESLP